jgi:hypothetical protein
MKTTAVKALVLALAVGFASIVAVGCGPKDEPADVKNADAPKGTLKPPDDLPDAMKKGPKAGGK